VKKAKVIIVGAGPAGLFAAYELVKQGQRDVLILEKGRALVKREKTETLCGVGGSGTFSDGKLHFSLVLSHEKLLDFCSRSEAQKLIDDVEKIFKDLGVKAPVTPIKMEEVGKLVKECQRFNVQLYNWKCRHVGSNVLPKIIQRLVDYLSEKEVVIRDKVEVREFEKLADSFEIRTGKGSYRAEKILVAPGRVGTKWLQI